MTSQNSPQDYKNDSDYQQWLYEKQLRSRPTEIQDNPREMPSYRSNVPYKSPESSHVRYKKLIRRKYADWRQVLGWICVCAAAMASFNLLLTGLKTVCPEKQSVKTAVIAPPKNPSKPKSPIYT